MKFNKVEMLSGLLNLIDGLIIVCSFTLLSSDFNINFVLSDYYENHKN